MEYLLSGLAIPTSFFSNDHHTFILLPNRLSVDIFEKFFVSELKSERVFIMFFIYQENFFNIVIINVKYLTILLIIHAKT